MILVKNVLWRIEYVTMTLITQKMFEKAVGDGSWHLKHVPDHFKTQGMREKAVQKDPWRLCEVSHRFKNREMCERAVQKNLLCLEYVPDHFLRCDCF